MLQPERMGSCYDDHIELIDEHNHLHSLQAGIKMFLSVSFEIHATLPINYDPQPIGRQIAVKEPGSRIAGKRKFFFES